jgi:chromosomal replication initiation ATPase DnaA
MTAHVEKVAPSRSFVMSVVRVVAEKHNVKIDDVLGASRTVKAWNARREALTLIHEAGAGRFSTTGIGKAFGCDHTTVLYNIKHEHYRARRRAQVLARHNEARG